MLVTTPAEGDVMTKVPAGRVWVAGRKCGQSKALGL